MRTIVVVLLGTIGVVANGQSQKWAFKAHATIQSDPTGITIDANDPRPLDQSLTALREEYGLEVDYEDPVYSGADVKDDTDPAWAADNPSKHVTIPRGGAFTAKVPAIDVSGQSVNATLNSLVAAYLVSGNPGKFKVISEGPRRFAVIPETSSLLDTTVQVAAGTRSFYAEINEIVAALGRETGIAVDVGNLPPSWVTKEIYFADDGRPAVARAKLVQLLSTTRYACVWKALYDADGKRYFLNISVASIVDPAALPERRLKPLTQ